MSLAQVIVCYLIQELREQSALTSTLSKPERLYNDLISFVSLLLLPYLSDLNNKTDVIRRLILDKDTV